jgi:hypothetical protein
MVWSLVAWTLGAILVSSVFGGPQAAVSTAMTLGESYGITVGSSKGAVESAVSGYNKSQRVQDKSERRNRQGRN